MTKKILLSLALAAATFAVVPQADAAVNSGTRKEVLSRVQPLGADIKWNGKKVESLEFNCDGEEDYVIGGRAGNRYYIAIILGPLSRPSSPLTADFPVGTNEDGALCEKTPTVFVGSMDYDPAEMLGEAPEGFEQSATCNEVDLGGECVKYHIYWNAVAEKISFWK
ncbi:MAG: hypothetical protein ACSLFQ_10770 [Thermoanaerobaculia bacterium]